MVAFCLVYRRINHIISNFMIILLQDLFSAGSDTSSSTVEWAMVGVAPKPKRDG
jgi:hypothetical protein